jgi:hypothetical protein
VNAPSICFHERLGFERVDPINRPYQAIIKATEARGCELIVMASHGRRGASAAVPRQRRLLRFTALRRVP